MEESVIPTITDQMSGASVQDTRTASTEENGHSWSSGTSDSFSTCPTFHLNDACGRIDMDWAAKNFSHIWKAACEYVDNLPTSTPAAATGINPTTEHLNQNDQPEGDEALLTALYHAGSRLPGYMSFKPKSEAKAQAQYFPQLLPGVMVHGYIDPANQFYYQHHEYGYYYFEPQQLQYQYWLLLNPFWTNIATPNQMQEDGGDSQEKEACPGKRARKFVKCTFCRYKTTTKLHRLRDPHTGDITCPVLKEYVCSICGATGKNAHTESHCRVQFQNNSWRKEW